MTSPQAPRIFVSAGEPSGDLHGAAVVRGLRARHPGAVIEALGGPHMQAIQRVAEVHQLRGMYA